MTDQVKSFNISPFFIAAIVKSTASQALIFSLTSIEKLSGSASKIYHKENTKDKHNSTMLLNVFFIYLNYL
jgi:hypothetical protein